MWRILTLALFAPAAIAAKRAASNRAIPWQPRRMKDAEPFSRKAPYNIHPHTSEFHSAQQQYGPQSPSHNSQKVPYPEKCPKCPPLKPVHTSCRKADELCCLDEEFIEEGEVKDTYPFEGATCPFLVYEETAFVICNAYSIVNPDFTKTTGTLIADGEDTTTTNYISHRSAAFAAIGNQGLCYNVYSNVVPGDILDTTCSSSTLGPVTDVLESLAMGTSIMA
eukprot:Selendium_serpulae@DN6494_c0_g2_i4.p1